MMAPAGDGGTTLSERCRAISALPARYTIHGAPCHCRVADGLLMVVRLWALPVLLRRDCRAAEGRQIIELQLRCEFHYAVVVRADRLNDWRRFQMSALLGIRVRFRVYRSS